MSRVEVVTVETRRRPRRRNNLVARGIINFLAILITAKLLNGITLDSTLTTFFAAFILAGVNAFVRPFLFILSLPLTILTLGLFTFVVNALMLLLTAWMLPGFSIAGFWTAFFAAILMSVFSSIISAIFD